jgi:general secretion pathway protein K
MVNRRPARYRRGIALLATMLAVALMTLLVVEFTTSAALGYRSAANQADELRAYYLARSGVQVGVAVLEQSTLADSVPTNGSSTPIQYDSLNQLWAQPTPPIPVDGGLVSTSIVDEDRKINVNLYLSSKTHQPDPIWAPIIVRLLANLEISPDILPILTDWLDPDSIESQGGAEADYYLTLTPPYEPRNGPIPTIYDLRMLKGMDDATFFKLSRYLTAATGATGSTVGNSQPRININTAPPEVLAALAPELENDPSLVEAIVSARAAAPFTNITDLKNRVSGLPETPAFQSLLTVQSSCFTITGEGAFAGTRKRIYATFKRVGIQQDRVIFALMAWHED